jgi:hypothetical protein
MFDLILSESANNQWNYTRAIDGEVFPCKSAFSCSNVVITDEDFVIVDVRVGESVELVIFKG